jgi:hypothetical protein
MMPQPGKTLPEVNIALAQVEAQEAELGRQQRLVQKELQKLETQQQILDQKMEQNEAAEAQLEGLQLQLTGQQAAQAMQGGMPGQAQAMMQGVMPQQAISPLPPWHRPFPAQAMQPGMGWQGTGIWGRRRSRGSYFITGAVVVAGLYILGRNSDTLRPVTVGLTKEGLAFKDWLTGSMVSVKKRLRGVAGEAKQVNRKEKKGKADFSAKEENVLKELDKHLEKLEKELEEKGGL